MKLKCHQDLNQLKVTLVKEAGAVVEQKQVSVKEVTTKVVMHATFATTEGSIASTTLR